MGVLWEERQLRVAVDVDAGYVKFPLGAVKVRAVGRLTMFVCNGGVSLGGG